MPKPVIARLVPYDPPTDYEGARLYLFCPACDLPHCPQVSGDKGPTWEWNGDLERPTLKPSLRVTGTFECHSFVTDGQWHYLEDCTHAMKGKVVDLAPLPDWLLR